MSNENMTWQEVCRELLRLDAEGHKEPWLEFEYETHAHDWLSVPKQGMLFDLLADGSPVRLKPRTVRVTTHNGETLELPKPWWDVPENALYYLIEADGEVVSTYNCMSVFDSGNINYGNAFRAESDAQAWADAMPKIKGAK